MTATKTTPTQTAEAIIARAKEYGFQLESGLGGEVLTAIKWFEAGNAREFAIAESQANEILSMIKRVRPGTTWGTDGGSVGGYDGLQRGMMRLNKSGVDKRVVKIIARRQGQ